MGSEQIYNFRKISDDVITGGHPTEGNLRDVADEGYDAVVNLAPVDGRSLPDEAGFVGGLGMGYHHIPVAWDAPTADDFAAFESTLDGLAGGRILIHCAANFRVTAFYSLYAQKHLGWSVDRARELRSSIWDGSDYPIWNAFIDSTERAISARASREDNA